jgi:hypothetical protein
MNRDWRRLEGNVRELPEKELLLLEEDVVGIEPQDFLPWPRYSDTRDFTNKLRSTVIGSVYSRNEREKCITIMVVKNVTPYILGGECQNFVETHFLNLMVQNYAYWSLQH